MFHRQRIGARYKWKEKRLLPTCCIVFLLLRSSTAFLAFFSRLCFSYLNVNTFHRRKKAKLFLLLQCFLRASKGKVCGVLFLIIFQNIATQWNELCAHGGKVEWKKKVFALLCALFFQPKVAVDCKVKAQNKFHLHFNTDMREVILTNDCRSAHRLENLCSDIIRICSRPWSGVITPTSERRNVSAFFFCFYDFPVVNFFLCFPEGVKGV